MRNATEVTAVVSCWVPRKWRLFRCNRAGWGCSGIGNTAFRFWDNPQLRQTLSASRDCL